MASLFSIANKYIWVDKECVVDDVRDPEWSTKSPYVNKWYLLRVIWRFSVVTVRFSIFSLIWSVLGGAFLGIFIPSSLIYWFLIIQLTFGHPWCGEYMFVNIGYGFVALISTPGYNSRRWAICHGVEMILTLSVITVFAFTPSFDCGICADSIARQATNNYYILSFIIAGWLALMIDFITYFVLLKYERFSEYDTVFVDVVTKGTGIAAAQGPSQDSNTASAVF